MTTVTPIKLRLSNAYLIRQERAILVDTGAPGEADKIWRALRAAGVNPTELALILHTHVHVDHVGSTTVLRQQLNAPTAYHPADQRLMDQGHNGRLQGIGLRGRMMSPLFQNARFPPFAPDIELTDGMSLQPYGIDGQVLHTPGHTAGSVSLLLADGTAVIADLLMGGYLGGAIWPGRPNYHYFAESFDQVKASLQRVMAFSPKTLYVGHGGPLAATAVPPHFYQHL